MIPSSRLHYPAVVVLLLLCSVQPYAQVPTVPIDLKKPFYIDVNQASKNVVYDIRENEMGLIFNDGFGLSRTINLQIKRWDEKVVGNFVLDKTAGQNEYKIDLGRLSEPFSPQSTYVCFMIDEQGNHFTWYIRNAVNPKSEIDASIRTQTVALQCQSQFGNLMKFYGVVKNASPPYSISWYVLNENRSDFLLQPRNEIVDGSGNVSMIEVDNAPAYYVVMDVTDACGNNTRKMVYITCQEDKKKVHSIFVEPVKKGLKPTKHAREQ